MLLRTARLLLGFTLTSGAAMADPMIDQGRELFSIGAQPPCSICHALKDAAATGEIGPSLDDLRPDEDRVLRALRNGIGQMPAYSSLAAEEQEILAGYIARVSRE